MSNDVVGIVLVLIQEVGNAGEGNLVYVFVNLFLGHSYAVVANSDGALVGIHAHAYC